MKKGKIYCLLILIVGVGYLSGQKVDQVPAIGSSLCKPSSGRPIMWRPLEDAKVGITPYGYINCETYYDTREIIGSREEHIVILPAPRRPDAFGRDINAHASFHITMIESRVGLRVTGPEWGCIKTSGIIEGDFRGITDDTIGSFRIRHAYGKVEWPTGSFIFGQFWHPLFVVECFPHTVTFAVGAPIEPQARDPQFRVTQRFCRDYEVIFAALSQRDFASPGPRGFSTEYIRNSLTPNFHLQFRRYFGEGDNLIGVAGDFKRLVPRVVTDKNVKVHEHINSFIFEAFAAFTRAPFSVRMKGIYAQNGADQLVLGGYAVSTIDPVTDFRTYTNINAAGGWIDMSYIFCCDSMELGLFVGGIKNLGTRHRLFLDPTTGTPIAFTLSNISERVDYTVQVFPRYVFRKDPIRFGLEVEFTRAAFGTPDRCGRVRNTDPVNNVRVLAALYYIF